MASIRPCPGPRGVNDSRTWYIPAGKTSSECTYCEECFIRYIRGTDADRYGAFTTSRSLGNCTCDYPKNYANCSLERGGMRVMIVDAKTSTMYPVLEGENIANLNGVMHVVVPTATEYTICVENMDKTSDHFFAIESAKVGEKPIVINGGKIIYYKNLTEVKGFATGTNDSFMFMSQSSREKIEGIKPLDGENVSNIISLKIQKMQRRPRLPSVPTVDWCGTERFRGSGKLQSSSRGMAKGFDCDDDNDGMERFAKSARNSDTRQITIETGTTSFAGLTGGATMSGGTYVELGEPVEFLIQLVCDQDDETKYAANQQHRWKLDLVQRDALLGQVTSISRDLAYYERQIATYQAELVGGQKRLDNVLSQLKTYAHLGSTNKEDHLLQFP